MPINTNLNQSPYFDDYDQDKQFNRVLFKPGFAVQARELTQLQSILQNQIEQFGDNIFKEGSIVKGCTFNNIDDLRYVKLEDTAAFDPTEYESRIVIEDPTGDIIELDYVYIITGSISGLQAQIIKARKGSVASQQNPQSTFWIKYLNTTASYTQFTAGESFSIDLYKYKRGTQSPSGSNPTPIFASSPDVRVSTASDRVGKAFGIQMSPGIIFQKGHFVFASEQTLIIENYSDVPSDKNVGFETTEQTVSALQDDSLFDNAYGSKNENAPGADRLKLTPNLVVKTPTEANADADFFTIIRYQNGNAVGLRDVSQYNILGEEMARRTYEESGNYVLESFPVSSDDRIPEGSANTEVTALLGQGVAYVKGFRIENSGERSFTIDQIQSTETVNNQSIGIEYGHYVDVTGFSGRLDIDHTPVTLQDNTNGTIGTAIALNLTPTRLYLSNIALSGPITNLDRVSDGNGYVEVGNKLKEVSKKPLIFDSGLSSVFELTDTLIPVRQRVAATHSSGAITLTANPGEDFDCQQDDILVIADNGVQWPVTGLTKSLNNSQMDFNIDSGANTNVFVYHNRRLVGTGSTGIDSYNKVIREPWVKVTYSGNAQASDTQYNLGFPDVFEIKEIKDTTGADFTSSFRLVRNQKDQYYDLSYIEYIAGRPKPADGSVLVNIKCFELSSSTGEYFFSINSYPNTLDRNDIPVHVSDTGVQYNLRECIDFRPHCDIESGVSYSATESSANAGSATQDVGVTQPTFSTYGAPLIPAINESATTDIEHYLARIDSIVADSYGEFSLVKGKENARPVPPQVENDKLVIATAFVPGYPALSSKDADTQRKREYAVRITPTGVKAYRMKDMHNLEKKIDNMAYYISLNQLESDTQNLTILDENGLSRFKNGFVVEPFNNLSLANINSPEFRSAVPFNQRILTPAVKTFPIDLKYKSNTSGTIFPSVTNPKVATLTRDSNVDVITQPYATNFRNCVSNFFKYIGEGVISPPYDASYDTTTNPVTLEIDLASHFRDFVDNIQQFLPMTDTTATSTFDRDEGRAGRRGAGTQTTTITTRTSEITVNDSVINMPVGDFVSNFEFEPFMASRDIKIYMSGLRPNTPHYFYFDGQDVNAHIIPGSTASSVDGIERLGDKGVTSVSTDANGNIYAVFNLPAETFYVGDRVLEIADVNQYSSIDSASTSKGFITYRAYNFSVEKSALTTSTRAPDFDVNTTTTTRNVIRRIRGRDPIAQTFFIKKGMGRGSNSVYLSEVDVFFKRVATEKNGITLQVREVINGYPTNQIVPFSKVHKLHTELTSATSDDASVATTFAFDAPIRLDVEKEYAIVLQPDASDPNYLVFTSKVGGIDLTPGTTQGTAIVQDWGDGVLFTSTNNSAWSSYQDEDMKFTLRRANFSASTGSVTLTNNDDEFLTVNNITGAFNVGEKIYQEDPVYVATPPSNGVNVTQNSNVVTSGGDLNTIYSDGDFIKISNGSDIGIYKIASVDSAVQLTLTSPWGFASVNGTDHLPVTVGVLSYLDKRNAATMHLTESSATSTRPFQVGQTIKGLDSTKTADITSIDNINISYFQPFISQINDSVSSTTFEGTFVSPDNVNITYDLPLQFNDNNHYNQKGVILYSKSNDPSRTKSFDLIVNMENNSNVTSSPFVDIEVSKLLAYQYTLSNTAADSSAFVSKTVELASDLDAEDINVIVTGYRPTGTDIKVYIRAQSPFDSAGFETVPWTELELFEGVGTFCSKTNIRDYKEFRYRIADANKNAGVYEYTSSNGTFQEFRRFAIKIELLSSNIHNAPTLMDYRAIALT